MRCPAFRDSFEHATPMTDGTPYFEATLTMSHSACDPSQARIRSAVPALLWRNCSWKWWEARNEPRRSPDPQRPGMVHCADTGRGGYHPGTLDLFLQQPPRDDCDLLHTP